MARRLNLGAKDFGSTLQKLLDRRRASGTNIGPAVTEIIESVRRHGDAALVALTERHDGLRLTPGAIRLDQDEIREAAARTSEEVRAALALAAERIEAFHRAQLPLPVTDYVDETGVTLGARFTPLDSVGLYVPGGRAAYPSSVLMNAIPAKVAGVRRLAMAAPTPGGSLNPAVLAAAEIAGVNEIYRLGGAQAVAALAYGAESVAPVDKIVGPGNAWVAEAKRQVFGQVGIDSIAGPSEVLIVADAANDPEWMAADLMAQAEHDPLAQSILITDDPEFADRVANAVERLLKSLDRAEVAGLSWRDHGAIILVSDLEADAPALVDRIAPEHLQLAIENPEGFAARVRHAGAIFLGRFTPEAVGDYVAGPNHVLPTAGSARFSSGLSVLDFVKRTTLVGMDAAGLAKTGPAASTLARAEGLGAHALSVDIRLGRGGY